MGRRSRIGTRRDVAARLVEEDVAAALRALDAAVVDANVVVFEARLGAELGDRAAVDRDASLRDERFRGAPRRDAGGGEDLLQPLGHGSVHFFFFGHGCGERGTDSSTAVGPAAVTAPPARCRTAAASRVADGSASPPGSSKPSASDISSTFGRSLRSFRPKRSRNSRVVAYMNGRPTTCLRPTVLIRRRSISVDSTPPLLLTPRISAISAAVTGCL